MVSSRMHIHHDHGRRGDENMFVLLLWEYVYDELYVEREIL